MPQAVLLNGARHLPLIGLVALAGCGSSADPPKVSAAVKPASTTPGATAAPAPVSTAAKKAAVTIKDFEYAPKQPTVAKGTTVVWTNKDVANHTVTFDAGAQKSLGNQRTGVKRSMRFAAAGTYAYHCDFHPNMHGTVVVR